MAPRYDQDAPQKPFRESFHSERAYQGALMSYRKEKAEWKKHNSTPVDSRRSTGGGSKYSHKANIASGGQKQGESSCPPQNKVAERVKNQGTARVTYSIDVERKRREEAEEPKSKIVHQQTSDPRM